MGTVLIPSSRAIGICAISLCAIGFTGCSNNVSSVSGQVTYRGTTVTSGVVNFLPTSGKPSGSPIGNDGAYACRVPPGQYAVVIVAPASAPEGWQDGDPPPTGKPQVPIKYGSPKTSGLTAEIDDSSTTLDFELD